MGRIIFTLFCVFAVSAVSAQNYQQVVKKNTLFLELGGNGGYYSINYDRIVLDKQNWKLAGRIGAMIYREELNYLESNHQLTSAVPLELSYLRGKGNHLLELGLGLTPVYQNYVNPEESRVSEQLMLATGRIGYRYQRSEGGLFFKAGFTPMLELGANPFSKSGNTVFPWAGLAIGYTLTN